MCDVQLLAIGREAHPQDRAQGRHLEGRPGRVRRVVVAPEVLVNPDVELAIRGVPPRCREVAPGRKRLIRLDLEHARWVAEHPERGRLRRAAAADPGEHVERVPRGVVRHALDIPIAGAARDLPAPELRCRLEGRAADHPLEVAVGRIDLVDRPAVVIGEPDGIVLRYVGASLGVLHRYRRVHERRRADRAGQLETGTRRGRARRTCDPEHSHREHSAYQASAIGRASRVHRQPPGPDESFSGTTVPHGRAIGTETSVVVRVVRSSWSSAIGGSGLGYTEFGSIDEEAIAVQRETGTFTVKSGLAEMLKGGVIMDVTTAEQAKIAEDAGACAVMALERVPADIRKEGGVARMADPTKIEEIKAAVSVPVMAKARIGHFVEAQVLQALGVDYIDESEVLTPADEEYHIDKWAFTVPFVCGCRNLGEALRRIAEGAAMIRTKGEAGTGNVVEAVRHERALLGQIAECVRMVAETARLPVVNFSAGGIATPADAALMMQLGVDGVFVGSGIFKSEEPATMARAIVEATTHFQDPDVLAKVSHGLGEPMHGLEIGTLQTRLQDRGW
ncbi:MAG: pyridoxal 5'-phosphate synthase subunit PdxS [Actinobacteria bacterium]|nr:MAG: pyridoxal 5'-phosphate synthase subunit PdxS [Actinomycetota bacterium]